MKKILFTLFTLSFFISHATATTKLKTHLADPDGIIFSDTLYFAGTDDGESIPIYSVSMLPIAQGSSNVESSVTEVGRFNPRNVVAQRYGVYHRYCLVAAPDLALLPDGTILMTFTAVFKANTHQTCAQVEKEGISPVILESTITPAVPLEFGDPQYAAYPHVGVYNTSSLHPSTMNNQYMRIDPSIFVEGQNTWLTYTWFDGQGNRVSTINRSQATKWDNTIPNTTYDEHITEAGEIFKRGNYYYLIYSENWFDSKYQAYYKKALSLSGLTPSSPTCRLTFNSWETRPNNTSSGYNSGHGGVVQYGSDYYFIYHYNSGIGGSSFVREVYMDKLDFHPSGNIKQIPAPAFVDNGNQHIGNLPNCEI